MRVLFFVTLTLFLFFSLFLSVGGYLSRIDFGRSDLSRPEGIKNGAGKNDVRSILFGVTDSQLSYLEGLRQGDCQWVAVEQSADSQWLEEERTYANFFLLQAFSEIAVNGSRDQEYYYRLAEEQLDCFEKYEDAINLQLPEYVLLRYGSADATFSLYWGSWLYAISIYSSVSGKVPEYALRMAQMLAGLSVDKEKRQQELRRVQGLARWGQLTDNPYFISRAEDIFRKVESGAAITGRAAITFYETPQFLRAACILKGAGFESADDFIAIWLRETQAMTPFLKGRSDESLIWYQIVVAADACLTAETNESRRVKLKNIFKEAIKNELAFFDPQLGGFIELTPFGQKKKTISVNAELARILYKYIYGAYGLSVLKSRHEARF